MRSTLLALALLTSTVAHAVQPEGAPPLGIEPQRVFQDHPAVQLRLATEPAWQDFLQAHPDWTARFDEATGAPWRMSGGPIPMPTDSEGALTAAVQRFFEDNAELLKIRPGSLVLRDAKYVERLDSWYIDFDTLLQGAPIWRGGVTANLKRGNLVMIGALAYGDRPALGSWTVDASGAIDTAIAQGPAPAVRHTDRSAERIWLPTEGPQGIQLVATWMVRTHTTEVPGLWVSFVDAQTGALLSVHNEVRFADGTVTGWHAERTLDGSPLVQSPLAEAAVTNGIDVVFSAQDGSFALPDGADYTTDLNGGYVEVVNTSGPEAEMTQVGPDLDWTVADATQAEISSYVFLHQVRTWGQAVAPEVQMVQGPIRSNVNVTSGTCNAYFDGEVNFYASGGGCSNTGQIGDVNYHEWGHGFHLWSVRDTWNGFDGSLSEGAADTVAFLQTHDSAIAPHFFNNGGSIRNVSPNRVYPDDYSDSEYAVHDNGLIFGGSMWDLWGLLQADEGEVVGTQSLEAIFSGLLKSGPGVADAYEAALFADDDDGDLANGTPHECLLVEAFAQHGLGPLGSGEILLASHTPQKIHATPDLPYPIEVEARSASPNCYGVDPIRAAVHYAVDGGGWQEGDLGLTGAVATGEIPAQGADHIVEYYLEIEDANGETLRFPRGGPINPIRYYSGPVLEVLCEDFEKNKGKFKHELLKGDDLDGADDWQWGAPSGNGGDPSSAFSGNYVWGNDLGWDQYNGEYQSDKKNRLYSPVLDTAHYLGAFLSYQRWLTVEIGSSDHARIRADGARVWSNVEDLGDHVDADWVPQAIDLEGAGDDGAVELEWSIESDDRTTFGGWNIDDVCVLAPDTADNRLGIDDFTAVRRGGLVEISFVQPRHDPVVDLTLVRNDAHAPTGPQDGDVVWHTDAIELGATAAFVDTRAPTWDVWYALYSSDGTNVLSWTREGFNSAFVAGSGAAPEGSKESPAGCGCSSSGLGGTWAGAILLIGLLGWRRD